MPDDQRTDRGAVVITGTSTGIGAATAIHLAEMGSTSSPA
jgi:short-subunit dehydrogenase